MDKWTGWVKLYRAVQEHWLWSDKPFAKGQAWIDLILLANHEDVQVLRGNQLQTFCRGEVAAAMRDLAIRWGWSKHKVHDFLTMLESEGMIGTAKGPQGTIIKLSNYAAFQDDGAEDGNAKGTQKDHVGTTSGPRRDRNKNEKNEKNDKKYIYNADGVNARAKFLLEDGTYYVVTDEELQDLSARYPMLSVPAELQTIESWCEANPGRRKTRSGARRFIVNWLNKAKRDMDTAKMAAQTYAAAGLKPTPKNSFHNFEQRSDSLDALFAGDITGGENEL